MDIDKPPVRKTFHLGYPAEEAYEIERYCKKMQIRPSHLLRMALEEYLSARGIILR